MFISILLFFYISFGLSFIINYFTHFKQESYIEQFIVRIGFGILAFTLLGTLLDLLFIPLNIWIYTLIATLLIAHYLYKNKLNITSIIKHIKSTSSHEYFFSTLAFILFLITLFMYLSGTFSYTYFENGDPWGYTAVSKVISQEQTFKADYRYNHYSEPYTQGYQILMGVLHQSNDSIYLTMKIFHQLILSLSILFFYVMIKQIFRHHKHNYVIAFLATFILFAIPSWVSKFIFSLSFNMALIPILLYFLFKIDEDEKWKYAAMIAYGSIIINHFFTAFIITLLILFYYIIKVFATQQFNKEILETFFGGILLSLIFHIPTITRYSYYFENPVHESHGGLETFLQAFYSIFQIQPTLFIIATIVILILTYLIIYYNSKWFIYVKPYLNKEVALIFISTLYIVLLLIMFIPQERLIDVEGTASREYTFNDFFFASEQNMINNPLGWGIIISLLVPISLLVIIFNHKLNLFTTKHFPLLFSLLTLILLFILVHGMRGAIVLMPFRLWTFMALFVSIAVGYGIYLAYINSNKLLSKEARIIIISILLLTILLTSFVPKFNYNTQVWPEHRIYVQQSYPVYEYLRNELPSNSKVIHLCRDSTILYGYDVDPLIENREVRSAWREEQNEIPIHQRFYNESLEQIHKEIKELEYEYAILGASCIVKNQENAPLLQKKLEKMGNMEEFELVVNTQSAALFKIK